MRSGVRRMLFLVLGAGVNCAVISTDLIRLRYIVQLYCWCMAELGSAATSLKCVRRQNALSGADIYVLHPNIG